MTSAVRLFMTYAEFERLVRDGRRKSKRVGTDLAHVILPSERRMYPVGYISTLLSAIAEPITVSLVRSFNSSARGRRAIAVAKAAFIGRLNLLAASCHHPGHLPIASVSSLLGLCPTTVYCWHDNGILRGAKINGQKYVEITDLVRHCVWHSRMMPALGPDRPA